jgi:hypothetical protein
MPAIWLLDSAKQADWARERQDMPAFCGVTGLGKAQAFG